MGGTVSRGHSYCPGMEDHLVGPNSSRLISDHESRGFTVTPLVRSEHLSAVCIRLDPEVSSEGTRPPVASCRVVAGSAFVSGGDGIERAHGRRGRHLAVS